MLIFIVIGDVSGQIHFEGYQVSNQCMALVKSKILLPTYDAPELGYIKETSAEQYVPDVYYKVYDRSFLLNILIVSICQGERFVQ
jgi:nuclear protein localization protein 4 homolog